MSEPDTLPVGVHPEAALLTWYATGTLSQEERQRVSRHLESCADCRRELDEIKQLKAELVAHYELQPVPSPRLEQSVFAKVSKQSGVQHGSSGTTWSWLDHLDQWLRSLLAARWVPTAAALFIITQLGVLFWLTVPHPPPEGITTRSIGTSAATFKVTFEEQATEKEIHAVLTAIGGRIIDGPDASHAYIIEVRGSKIGVATEVLQALRQRSGVVRTVESLSP